MEVGTRRSREKQGCLLHPPLTLFLLLAFFVFLDGSTASNNYTHHRQVSTLRLARIRRHLDRINKRPVKTIQSPDGDVIDCVHRRRQPALDHPLLKSHKIQRVPTMTPVARGGREGRNLTAAGDGRGETAWQTWHQNGEYCPKGTVPIRRSSVEDVLRAKSLFHYGKKQSKRIPLAKFSQPADVVSGSGHEVGEYTTES